MGVFLSCKISLKEDFVGLWKGEERRDFSLCCVDDRFEHTFRLCRSVEENNP
jgi:hypothetical protein